MAGKVITVIYRGEVKRVNIKSAVKIQGSLYQRHLKDHSNIICITNLL